MQIVIDIDEDTYKDIKKGKVYSSYRDVPQESVLAIANGTPLPKGHGRLIDADAFIAMMKDVTERQKYEELLIDDCLTVDDVFDAIIESLQNEGLAEGDSPTIIEADKAEREDKR